jgi:hypothetical protein
MSHPPCYNYGMLEAQQLTLSPIVLKDSTLPWERQVGFIPVNKSDRAVLDGEYGEDNWGEVWEDHAELGTLRYLPGDIMLEMLDFGFGVKLVK